MQHMRPCIFVNNSHGSGSEDEIMIMEFPLEEEWSGSANEQKKQQLAKATKSKLQKSQHIDHRGLVGWWWCVHGKWLHAISGHNRKLAFVFSNDKCTASGNDFAYVYTVNIVCTGAGVKGKAGEKRYVLYHISHTSTHGERERKKEITNQRKYHTQPYHGRTITIFSFHSYYCYYYFPSYFSVVSCMLCEFAHHLFPILLFRALVENEYWHDKHFEKLLLPEVLL